MISPRCRGMNLLNHLNQYSEIERIRYTTSHPINMSEQLILKSSVE